MATKLPKDYSPFTPGLPVPVEFFVGRQREIERLNSKVAQAATGRLQVAFVSGERGIGKSSLVSFVRSLAERDHGAIGAHVFLGGVTTLQEMVRRTFDRLFNEGISKGWFEKVRDLFGDRVRKVGLFGVSVEFDASDRELHRLTQDFAPVLRRVIDRLGAEKRCVLIVLDDINGLADSSEFAHWIKSITDEIATSQPTLPLCLVLVGLEERRRSLIDLQPSLARIFDIVSIDAWSPTETEDFFRQTFSKVGLEVENRALKTLADFAGGLPMLAHELGDATFKANKDDIINAADVIEGAIAAADVVGRKYLEHQVFLALRSKKYRKILSTLAEMDKSFAFSRSELKQRLAASEAKVLDNFLRKLRDLGVLEPDVEEGPGRYRFRNRLHHLYIVLEAESPERN